MGVQARDVLLFRCGNRLLRLYNLDRIGNAGGESVPCLYKRFPGERSITICDDYLLTGGIEAKKRVAHFEVNAAKRVLIFCPALRQNSVCLCNIGLNAAASPYRKVNAAEK